MLKLKTTVNEPANDSGSVQVRQTFLALSWWLHSVGRSVTQQPKKILDEQDCLGLSLPNSVVWRQCVIIQYEHVFIWASVLNIWNATVLKVWLHHQWQECYEKRDKWIDSHSDFKYKLPAHVYLSGFAVVWQQLGMLSQSNWLTNISIWEYARCHMHMHK